MTTIPSEDISYWVPEYPAQVMDHFTVVRHLAWAKANTYASWEDIGRPLGMSKSRAQEVMTDPDTRLSYAYRLRITMVAVAQYPAGVPILKAYEARAETPEESLDRAFGRSSEPANQQRLIPQPAPIVVTQEDPRGEWPGTIHGDEDFNRTANIHNIQDHRAYIYRLEARVKQLEDQLALFNRGTELVRERIAGLEGSLKGMSEMVADKTEALKRAEATIRSLSEDLTEAQAFIDDKDKEEDLVMNFMAGLRRFLDG